MKIEEGCAVRHSEFRGLCKTNGVVMTANKCNSKLGSGAGDCEYSSFLEIMNAVILATCLLLNIIKPLWDAHCVQS